MVVLFKNWLSGFHSEFAKRQICHEFSYCGQLYDIVQRIGKGKRPWYYVSMTSRKKRLINRFWKNTNAGSRAEFIRQIKQSHALLYHLITIALIREPIVLAYPNLWTFFFGYNTLPLYTIEYPCFTTSETILIFLRIRRVVYFNYINYRLSLSLSFIRLIL